MQIIGLGTVVMMPLIGNMSDEYGRKAMLTLPMTLSIIPLGNNWIFYSAPVDLKLKCCLISFLSAMGHNGVVPLLKHS